MGLNPSRRSPEHTFVCESYGFAWRRNCLKLLNLEDARALKVAAECAMQLVLVQQLGHGLEAQQAQP